MDGGAQYGADAAPASTATFPDYTGILFSNMIEYLRVTPVIS